jgi:CHAD domain-containing protein
MTVGAMGLQDGSVRAYAAPVLLAGLDALEECLPGLSEQGDIERIHRARVACRRLSARLAAFGRLFPEHPAAAYRRHVRRLLRSLGAARDLDVAISALDAILEGGLSRSHTAGARRLRMRMMQDRMGMEGEIARRLGKFERSGTLGGIRAMVLEEPAGAAADEGVETLASLSRKLLGARLAALLEVESCTRRQEDAAAHHGMRIRVKRLRYATELFAGAVPGGFARELALLKDVQTLLGDLHDCDVWLARLDVFEQQEERLSSWFYGSSAPFGRIRTGVGFLRGLFESRRATLFRRLRREWPSFRAGLLHLSAGIGGGDGG